MSIFGTQSEGDFAAEVAKAAAEAPAADPTPAPEPAPEPAAPQAEAEPAPAEPQAQPAPQPEKEPERFVPLAAMQEERTKRQALEKDFNNLQEAFGRFQQQLQQPQQFEQQPDPLDVDPNQEPFQLIHNLKEEVKQWRAQRQAEVETGQIKTAYLGAVQQASTSDPTFKDAYNHLVQSRLNELTAMGMHPHAANETIKQEELHLARTAFAYGRNPADVIVGYAKARGFAAKAAEPPPPPPPPAEQVQAQAAKAAAATSISGGGQPPKADLSMSDIAGLQGAAFDAAWDKFAAKAGRSGNSLFRN